LGDPEFVYQLRPPPPRVTVNIFFLELVVIMSAIHHVASFACPPCRILLFTDSLDAVGVLNSLAAAQPLHNAPLRGITEIILATGLDIRVHHIAGKENVRADLLSRLLLDEYHRKFPADCVCTFDPPRDLLPAQWRQSF